MIAVEGMRFGRISLHGFFAVRPDGTRQSCSTGTNECVRVESLNSTTEVDSVGRSLAKNLNWPRRVPVSCRELHATVILILDGVASATQESRSGHCAVVVVRRVAPLAHPVVDFGFVLSESQAPQFIVARASH